MNKKTKQKIRKKIFAYLYDMKKGEENKVAGMIIDLLEMHVMRLVDEKKKIELALKKINQNDRIQKH